jgi:hypothetical protein
MKAHINICMRFFEFNSSKPLTPQQSKIASLKRNADLAKQALARERKVQQIQKAQDKIKKLSTLKIAP